MPSAMILRPITVPLKFLIKSQVAVFAVSVCNSPEFLRKGNCDNFQICNDVDGFEGYNIAAKFGGITRGEQRDTKKKAVFCSSPVIFWMFAAK